MKHLFVFLIVPVMAFSLPGKCKAKKKDGKPCHAVIVNKAGYCQAHDTTANRCGVKKKDGKPCLTITQKVVVNGEETTTACRFHSTEN